MKFNKEELKALKEAVEGTGYNFYQDQEVAKGNLDDLAKQIQDVYGIKKADFKKMVKQNFEATVDEEKCKVDQFYEMFKEITDYEEN